MHMRMPIRYLSITCQKQEIIMADTHRRHFIGLYVDECGETGVHSSPNKTQLHHNFSQSTNRLQMRDRNVCS